MKKIPILLCMLVFLFSCTDKSTIRDCYPVPNPTGSFKCYSGGSLVYRADTFRNGGVLCKIDGTEITYHKNFSGSFCIEESWQEDVWNPPTDSE